MQRESTPREPSCVCKTCGKRFYTKPSLIRLRNGGQHCSLGCKAANPDAFRRGADHPAWKGDAVTDKTGRERAQREYGVGMCERCGNERAVDRHHVDTNTRNNTPNNVQALCRRCHMDTDGRLDRLRTAQGRKLTAEQAGAIRAQYQALPVSPSGRRPLGSTAGIAAEFGVSQDTVRKIGRGLIWPETSPTSGVTR